VATEHALETRRSAHPKLDSFLGIRAKEERDNRRYLVYLLVIATAGWALASYDFNLLVVAIPTIAKSLKLSPSQVGLMAFVIYAAMMVISLTVGWAMDTWGRRRMWMLALVAAAVFTGLTYVVQNYWELVAVRALASGFANSELAISITLVNEEVPAERRGFLYSIVQGGWPLGVLIASGVFLGFNGLIGWHAVFLLGVAPLLAVIVGRFWVRPSERYQQVQELKEAKEEGDDERVEELLERYDVDVDEVEGVTLKQIFAEGGWVRSQLLRTSVVWILYSAAFVATNVYIVYWLTNYRHFGKTEALVLLLVSAGCGFFFYPIGGWLGERFGRQRVLIVSAACAVALNTLFYFLHDKWALWIVYFLIYQATNGTWSGVGYAYWAESFPTRVRGTAIGWLGAMFTGGLILGSGIWTALIGSASQTVVWFVIAVGFAAAQFVCSLFLPHIPPGQELEDVAT
jgi:MFS family permease